MLDSWELLLPEERIKNAVRLGESHFREFKSALEGPPEKKRRRSVRLVARDIGETLVSFANAHGGELLVGVEDDGTISGLSFNPEEIDELRKAYATHVHPDTPLPTPAVSLAYIEGKSVLYFSVQKGTRHVHLTADGRCLQRKDRDTIPVASEGIHFQRQEQLSREYDREFVEGADPAALNQELIQRIAEDVTPGMSVERCLQYLGLAEFVASSVMLRRAALLLFAKDIRRWHPRSEIRVLRIAGTEIRTGREYNVADDQVFAGNILEVLTGGWDLIRQHLVQRRLQGGTGTFGLQVVYPEDACREAFINAVAHRDYSSEGRNIEVWVYDDRLEIRSPGGLLSTLKISDLRRPTGVHDSRNA